VSPRPTPLSPAVVAARLQRSGVGRSATGRGSSAPWRAWHPSARLGIRPVPSGVSVRTAREHALPCGNPAWPLTNGLQLPLREQAEIPPAKLRDYALNPEHEEGRHKARVFAAALGIRREHWAYLRDQILRALESAPVTGVRLAGPWAMLYEVRIDIDGLNGQTHPIITVWFSRDAIGAPTLTTTYVDVP
jgi:hypothetical protein